MFKLDVIFASVAFVACGHAAPVLMPQVQPGPAMDARPNRVLVLHSTCGSVEAPCPEEYADTVDNIVRGGLEFAGYGVIGSETLFDQNRQRHEERTHETSSDSASSEVDHRGRILPFGSITSSRSAGEHEHSSQTIVLDGPGFDDLEVEARHDVMMKSGADSVVSVRIVVGGSVGVWVPNQTVEVMIKLGVDQGDTMAWASRCAASSNDFTTVTAALENAARCAVRGATSPRRPGQARRFVDSA